MIIDLHDPTTTTVSGIVRTTTQLTYAPGTIAPASVTYEVDPGDVALAEPSVLPLLPPAYVLACRAGQDLRVAEPVPPAMHVGARTVGELFRRWYGWRPAELIAPLGEEPVRHRRRPRGGVGLFFTRGIDSWSTLLRLLDGPMADRPTHLITVDNEVHLDQAVRDRTIADTRRAAERIGVPLIVVKTDVRAALDPHTDWGTDTHGSALAGIGLLLRPALGRIGIAPTHWTPLLRSWGSHPDLESNWSVPGLEVVHHPGDLPRWQRVELVARAQGAIDDLLVCWQGSSNRNCGQCEKCLRLMTSLDLLGALDRAADRFDVPLDPTRINSGLRCAPYPWSDTFDHLDHVGLDADALRQRWESVDYSPRAGVTPMDRPIQPRLPVRSTASPIQLRRLAEALARIGIRIDHQAAPPFRGPHLWLREEAARPVVSIEQLDAASAASLGLSEISLSWLEPLLEQLGLDPATAVPFDPSGQASPAAVPQI